MGLSRIIILCLLSCQVLGIAAQSPAEESDWYLDEVISDSFIRQSDFDYYYQPSSSDIANQRTKGEVSYFLNTPTGLNTQKVRNLIDQLMCSYDDIQAVCDWQMTSTTYWKEFRYEKNKFRFSVKRKALEDGTYYVSVTENANYYKSLGKKKKDSIQQQEATDKPTKRSSRKKVEVDEQTEVASDAEDLLTDNGQEETVTVSDKERRHNDRLREQERKQEERLAQKREQEQKRAEEKAQKEAEKQRKAEEKKQKEEAKLREREEQKMRREQERQEREQRKRDNEAAAAKEAAAKKSAASKYHCSDVALWLSEKYDFTMTAGDESSYTMYSTAIKDVNMAKLAIKNALKGSNARMAVPWRLNSDTQEVETGYTVDDHVLIFSIGHNSDGNVTLTMTEISSEQFELFKQSLSTTNN